jgi:dTDP-4-dehydrorhamnose 3,5-epimerase
MKFYKTEINGLIICQPKKHYDDRGFFSETFRKDLFENFLGYKVNFCQENFSESKFGVLRGLHFQKKPFSQSKLVSVINGKILDVVVDIRKDSKHYGKNFSIELDDNENKQLFIPRGFAHGFIVLSESAKVCYKVDNYYNPESECGLNYNDPLLNIDWKLSSDSIIVMNKDKAYPQFNSINHFDK